MTWNEFLYFEQRIREALAVERHAHAKHCHAPAAACPTYTNLTKALDALGKLEMMVKEEKCSTSSL